MASSNPTLAGNVVQALRPAATQSKAYTGTAGTIDNAIGASVVRVVCTTAAFVKVGTSPTATTSDMYVPANCPEYFRVQPGEKVSAVQVSSGGTLYVTEMD